MTWTWTRAGPREWRVERTPTPTEQAEADYRRYIARMQQNIGTMPHTPGALRPLTEEEMRERDRRLAPLMQNARQPR